MKSGYEGFSVVYDELMADYNYSAILAFIEETISVSGEKGLDLCSGTGTITIELAKVGAMMTGFDLDGNMLQRAAEKAKSAGQNIRFLQGNVNNIPEMQAFDFIVSTCDGVNYVKNIIAFSQKLFSILKPQGKVILEFSSLYKAEKILNNNWFYEDKEKVTWLFQNTFCTKNNTIKQDLTIFSQQPNGAYLRTDDCATQYFYAVSELSSALNAAGFCKVTVLDSDGFNPTFGDAERLTIVAEKE